MEFPGLLAVWPYPVMWTLCEIDLTMFLQISFLFFGLSRVTARFRARWGHLGI